jgi:hypothetical protein
VIPMAQNPGGTTSNMKLEQALASDFHQISYGTMSVPTEVPAQALFQTTLGTQQEGECSKNNELFGAVVDKCCG